MLVELHRSELLGDVRVVLGVLLKKQVGELAAFLSLLLQIDASFLLVPLLTWRELTLEGFLASFRHYARTRVP
jgi:hypothetical protein